MESGSAPNPPVPPEVFLTVLDGRAPGSRIAVAAEFQIGRGLDGEGRLGGDPLLSRRHAAIRRAPDGALTIEDCGSANGTYVNDKRITAPQALRPGDTVQVGSTTLRVETRGSTASSRIFISYRRQETAFAAGWLFGGLAKRFGAGQIFKDVDALDPGDDFVEKITEAVTSCDVLLALIGDQWLAITDEDGQRLLDRDDDWVRLEIEAALRRNIRVIPILVGATRMPRAGELPPSMAGLARRHALELSPTQFDFDLARLVKVLDQTLAEMRVSSTAAQPGTGDTTVIQGTVAGSDRGSAGPESAQTAPEPSPAAQEPAPPDAAGSRPPDPGEGHSGPASGPPAALSVPRRLTATLKTKVVNAVAFSPDGRLLASGSDDKTVQLWDPATGKQLRSLTGHAGKVRTVAFSPDGHLLASAGFDKAVRLWDPATGELPLRTLNCEGGRVNAVAFGPDGRLLATASYDTVRVWDPSTVQLWDPVTGEHVRTLTGHTRRVDALAFSPDGRLLASASDDRAVRLWDPATGEHARTLTGHTGWVRALAFSPDGRLLASASDDKTVRLWDPATGEHARSLTGHTGWVNAVAFSPDGYLVASASFDKAVRVWNPATGELLRALTGHGGRVNAVAFSPDGRVLASAGADKKVRLWR